MTHNWEECSEQLRQIWIILQLWGNCCEEINVFIFDCPQSPLVLGLPRLKLHNTAIDCVLHGMFFCHKNFLQSDVIEPDEPDLTSILKWYHGFGQVFCQDRAMALSTPPAVWLCHPSPARVHSPYRKILQNFIKAEKGNREARLRIWLQVSFGLGSENVLRGMAPTTGGTRTTVCGVDRPQEPWVPQNCQKTEPKTSQTGSLLRTFSFNLI